MMNKLRKIFEYLYVVMFVLAIIEGVRLLTDNDATNDTKALMFGGFAILAVAMFLIRRKQRLMIEKNKANKDN
jgi:hypothetical protein